MSSVSEPMLSGSRTVHRPAQPVIEICVDSLDLALAAQRGGAERIELCGPLEDGGVTPSAGLLLETRRRIDLPIAMLVRSRTGSFTASASEFAVMRQDILFAKQSGVDMIVTGLLYEDNTVDLQRTRDLVDLASPMPVTFHRAFDLALDPLLALEAVIDTGAKRVLTSGAAVSASDGAPLVRSLRDKAAGRVGMLLCGSIGPELVGDALRISGADEVHAALRGSIADALAAGRAYSAADLQHFEETVAALKARASAAWTTAGSIS